MLNVLFGKLPRVIGNTAKCVSGWENLNNKQITRTVQNNILYVFFNKHAKKIESLPFHHLHLFHPINVKENLQVKIYKFQKPRLVLTTKLHVGAWRLTYVKIT